MTATNLDAFRTQTELPFGEAEDTMEARHRRAFARMWMGCRPVAERKKYVLVDEDWKRIEKDARS